MNKNVSQLKKEKIVSCLKIFVTVGEPYEEFGLVLEIFERVQQ